jgi:predicted molibdopterin-dependent oxidoreductase YjgC
MFRRSQPIRTPVTLFFEGRAIEAEEGETVAAALFADGVCEFRRSAEDGGPRGPYCMIGNCFECLVEIEGLGSRQACRERAREGLRIRRHVGLPDPEREL